MALIAEDLRALAPCASKPLDEHLASPVDELVAERYLERIIGRLIDVNYHVLIESGRAPPRDCHDSFARMGALGVCDAAFARRSAGCDGLRNRIVHEYDAIDPARVHAALDAALRDIPDFLRRVDAFVTARQ